MDHTPVAPGRTDGGDARADRAAEDSATDPDERRRPRLVALAAAAIMIVVAAVGYIVTRPDDETPWTRTGPPIIVHGWAPYWQTDSALASFTENADVFTDVSLFAYHTTPSGAVSAYEGLGIDVLETYRAAAAAAGVRLTASILDDNDAGVTAAILADPATRATHIESIVQLAVSNDFGGIDIDYEKFAFTDGRSTWETTRPNWVAFIDELATALHAIDRTLTVSVPPMYDPDRTGGDRGYWVYDYEAMGQVVDFIRIMAYDYNPGEAGPIAPIEWVRGLVGDIREMVPPSKLILGLPVYGYNWPVSVLGVCPIDQEPKRQNQSTKSAAALAVSLGITPTYDADVAESTFSYNENLVGVDAAGAPTECTVSREVWYADARAVYERAWVAERNDLAGIGIWSLGSDDTAVWDGIDAARADLETWPPESESTTTVAPTVTTAIPTP